MYTKSCLATLITFIALGIILFAASNSAMADNLPAGGYQQSCRAMNASLGNLTAECRDRNDNWHSTRLDNYHQCIGDISNQDGNLRCSRGGAVPAGGYMQTCRDIWMEGSTLHASCKTRNDAWVSTVLANTNQCVGTISNQDGNLRCNRGGPVPGGDYTQTCRDSWMEGSTLHASCKTISGAWVSTILNNVGQCNGAIRNIDGSLDCKHGNAPPGSYQQSCRSIVVSGQHMTASCRGTDGGYGPTDFDLARPCSGDIYNRDGFLTCVRGGSPVRGSYYETCRDIAVTGASMSALCRRNDGSWLRTTLNPINSCPGDISNNNGQLQCNGPPANAVTEEVQTVCCSSAIPPGYILINNNWSPTQCEGTRASGIVGNMCSYERYDKWPIGKQLQVCYSALTPNGWVETGQSQIPTMCSTGINPAGDLPTVKTIQRLR